MVALSSSSPGSSNSPRQQPDLSGFREDFYFGFLFSNFVWRGYGSQWLAQAAEGRLDRLARDAARALAHSAFGRAQQLPAVEFRGRALYGRCLQGLVGKLGGTTTTTTGRSTLLLRGRDRDEDGYGGGAHEQLVIPILILMMHAVC